MPCSNACNGEREKPHGGKLTCNGLFKGMIGTCEIPTNCPGAVYPVGHFVKVHEFPSKGANQEVFAYQAISCADGVSKCGILGAIECEERIGFSAVLKNNAESCLFSGHYEDKAGIIEGTTVKVGYLDADKRFWALSMSGGTQFKGNNDQDSSVILNSWLPGGSSAVVSKYGVASNMHIDPSNTEMAFGVLSKFWDKAGQPIPGTAVMLSTFIGGAYKAAIFDGIINIGVNGRKTRAEVGIGDVYLNGETLCVKLN